MAETTATSTTTDTKSETKATLEQRIAELEQQLSKYPLQGGKRSTDLPPMADVSTERLNASIEEIDQEATDKMTLDAAAKKVGYDGDAKPLSHAVRGGYLFVTYDDGSKEYVEL